MVTWGWVWEWGSMVNAHERCYWGHENVLKLIYGNISIRLLKIIYLYTQMG